MSDFLYDIGDNLKDVKRDITIIDRKYSFRASSGSGRYKKYKYKCNKCGYDCGESYKDGVYQEEYWVHENHIRNGVGCSCCQGRAVVKGINDIETTNPYLYSLLNCKEDAYKYTEVSSKKMKFKCPSCGKTKITSPGNIKLNGLVCEYCSDKLPMGEKIIYTLLSSFNISFIKEYSKKDSNWVKNYRYDFFVEPDTIIEVMGSQHYDGSFEHVGGRSLSEEIMNDAIKKSLALDNGINHYIEIDASKSDFNFIKNSILASELTYLIDLERVDWLNIEKESAKSIIREAANYWNTYTDISTKDLAIAFHLSRNTATQYLKIANKLGLCRYDKEDWQRRKGNFYDDNTVNTSTPIRCLENNTYFKSVGLCARVSENVFGIKLNDCSIRSVLKGEYAHHRNFHFEYVTKEQFNIANNNGFSCYGSPFLL